MSVTARTRLSTLSGATLSESTYRPGEEQPLHAHDFTGIAVVLLGVLEERSAHCSVHAGPCSVVIKPAGTLHSNRFGPDGASMFAVRWPQASLAQRDGKHGAFSGYRWFHAGPVAAIALRLNREFREEGNRLDRAFESCLTDLSGQLESHSEPDAPRPESDRRPHIPRVASVARQRCSSTRRAITNQ